MSHRFVSVAFALMAIAIVAQTPATPTGRSDTTSSGDTKKTGPQTTSTGSASMGKPAPTSQPSSPGSATKTGGPSGGVPGRS